MGYTHYFKFKKVKGQAKQIEETYQKAILECQKICKVYREENKGTENSISGYAAHCKVGEYGGLDINGVKENAHENFVLREHFNQNEDFNFCKTARKPYDIVVTACLALLKHRLGDSIDVSSDGDPSDWIEGVALACRVTKLKVKNPLGQTAKLRLVG
jgi:hypothetical protein